MEKRLLLLMLCPALALGVSGKVQAQNESEQRTGTVTIQYMDFASSGEKSKPIGGAKFSFYRFDREKGRPQTTPYATMKTDAEGVLTAKLPEGVYKVSQEKNGVRYRTSDFLVTLPMKNEAGILTDAVEAIPKAEPLTLWSETTSEKKKTPSPGGRITAEDSENVRRIRMVKTRKVKTGDDGLYPAAAAAIASAAGLGTVMLVSRRRQRKEDEER